MLAKKTNLSIIGEGLYVILIIGDIEVKLFYKHALKVSHWLRHQGNKSRLIAGDFNIPIFEPTKDSEFLSGSNKYNYIPTIWEKDISVKAEGTTVFFNLKSTKIGLNYTNALQLGHWIRCRAKQCKSWAGDTSKDWNVIADLSIKDSIYEQYIKPNNRYGDLPIKLGGGK